jgi:hypothetical protein
VKTLIGQYIPQEITWYSGIGNGRFKWRSSERKTNDIRLTMVSVTLTNSSNSVLILWKEAVDQFIQDAGLSEEDKVYLKKSHTPDEILQEVKKTHHGSRANRKEKERRIELQQGITVALQIFGIIDIALNLAQVVYCRFTPCSSVGLPGPLCVFRGYKAPPQSIFPLCAIMCG